VEPFPLDAQPAFKLLATPAWRGRDDLDQLLSEWARVTGVDASACLYLLADPATAGSAEQVQSRVVDAAEAAAIELDDCADIEILFEPFRPDRDARLHAAMDAYVPLHAGCAGHERAATQTGAAILRLGTDALAAHLRASGTRV
jgi:hypothetical protein